MYLALIQGSFAFPAAFNSQSKRYQYYPGMSSLQLKIRHIMSWAWILHSFANIKVFCVFGRKFSLSRRFQELYLSLVPTENSVLLYLQGFTCNYQLLWNRLARIIKRSFLVSSLNLQLNIPKGLKWALVNNYDFGAFKKTKTWPATLWWLHF